MMECWESIWTQVDYLEQLQSNDSIPDEIYEKAAMMVKEYFGGEEDDGVLGVNMDTESNNNQNNQNNMNGSNQNNQQQFGTNNQNRMQNNNDQPQDSNMFAFGSNNNNQ